MTSFWPRILVPWTNWNQNWEEELNFFKKVLWRNLSSREKIWVFFEIFTVCGKTACFLCFWKVHNYVIIITALLVFRFSTMTIELLLSWIINSSLLTFLFLIFFLEKKLDTANCNVFKFIFIRILNTESMRFFSLK